MVILILAVFGLCLGSFVNALVWRFHEQAELRQAATPANAKQTAKKQKQLQTDLDAVSLSKGRSMCVHCRHELAPKDLIPVVSYLWLRGRCRYCRKPIDDTPIPELLTPILFVVSYLAWPLPLHGAGLVTLIFWLVFLVGFVALGLYDYRWYELPHRIVLPLIGVALIQVVLVSTVWHGGWAYVERAVWGAAFGGGLFYLLYVFSPKMKLDDGESISAWIGGGDITLGTLLGLLVGGPGHALLVIFLASVLGTLIAIPLYIRGKATRHSHLPFGPLLIVAAVIVQLWGNTILDWYLRLFSA